ncbi:MAG: response regulator [Chloroflexota bacterium]
MTLVNQTVIVVEDTYDDMQLVSTILEHSGIQVHVARNGAECLELVKTMSPAMIITDLSMPVMDGWTMLKQLRSQPETNDIPVVAITAYYSVDVAQDARDAGFDAYFAKPVSPLQFVSHLRALLAE